MCSSRCPRDHSVKWCGRCPPRRDAWSVGSARRIYRGRSYYKKGVRSGDIVEVHLNLILGQLSYSVNGEYLGVAFDGMDCTGTYCLHANIDSFDTDISIGSLI